MIYLICYDTSAANGEHDARVVDVLTNLKAVRCLDAAWLIDSSLDPMPLANQVSAALRTGDRLLVVAVGSAAYLNLMNERANASFLARAVETAI